MTQANVQYSVVVPAMNEAGNIVPLAREIAAAMARVNAPYEVIVVDDGSTDEMAAELASARSELKQLRVLVHGKNLGQSRAVRTGVIAARAPIVVTLDGDGQNDPADIPALLSRFQTADARVGLVAGERVTRHDNWRKRWASRWANRIRRFLLGDTARDVGCGLKAFRREAFLALPYFDHMHRYLITLMMREGYDVVFVNVGHRPRGQGRSKYGVFDRMMVSIGDLAGVIWLKRRHRGAAEIKEL